MFFIILSFVFCFFSGFFVFFVFFIGCQTFITMACCPSRTDLFPIRAPTIIYMLYYPAISCKARSTKETGFHLQLSVITLQWTFHLIFAIPSYCKARSTKVAAFPLAAFVNPSASCWYRLKNPPPVSVVLISPQESWWSYGKTKIVSRLIKNNFCPQ